MARDLKRKEPRQVNNDSFSRKRVFLLWGLVILICLPLVFILFKQIVSTVSFNSSAVIKNAKIYQTEGAVAGKPVKWTAIVNLKDIKAGEHLIQIPKLAKNIKVKTITAKEAKELGTIKNPQLTLEERRSLAFGLNNSFATSLGLSVKMFFAEAESVAQTVAESISSSSSDSQTVDVAPIVEQQTEPVQQDQPVETSTEAPTEIPASTETPILSVTSEDENLNPSTEIQASPSPEIYINKDEFIAVEYTTDGATIKEKKTKTGKIVVVSIPDEYSVKTSLTETPTPEPTVEGTPEAPPVLAPEAPASGGSLPMLLSQAEDIPLPTPEPTVEATPEATPEVSPELSSIETPTPSLTPTPIVSPEPSAEAGEPSVKNVLAYTTIPEIFKVGQEKDIKIIWRNNGNKEMEFKAEDLDGNGLIDYIEWNIPHLSEQTFEIIFISKAFELDSSQNIVADIYDQVSQKEGTWADGAYATVIANNYVRVTFEQVLDNTKDITIYMRPTPGAPNGHIEVYPVYDDGQGNLTEGPMLDLVSDGQNPDFSNIDHDGKYRVLLKNLQTPTDMFDLRVSGGVDFDYIVDPTVTDTFADQSKIASSTNITVSGGQVKLTVTWTCGTSTVLDVDGNTYSTVSIGTQCWTTTNMMTTKYPDGSSITRGAAGGGWNGSDNAYYAYPPNTGNTAEETLANIISKNLGFVYQWSAVMYGSTAEGVQGICPTGWHVPTDTEYTTLTTYLANNQGDRMKQSGLTPNICYGATPPCGSSGFNGLLAGDRGTDGSFDNRGAYGYFWSSTQYTSTRAWRRYLNSSDASVARGSIGKASGFSVRCLKN